MMRFHRPVVGRIDCNKDIKDGCETDISADPLNCGACGAACPGAAQGQAQCIDRQCSTCPRGRGDCDKDPTNGCEAPRLQQRRERRLRVS